MKKILTIILVSLIVIRCTNKRMSIETRNETFSKELTQLKEYFHIPGLAVIIKKDNQTIYENYSGFADVNNKTAIDSTTTFPIASLTKLFTSVLIMQLVENEKASLDAPINRYVTDANIGDSIKIRHVLSHTSQGNVGEHFYYSGRFGWLTDFIQKEYETTFEKVIQDKIIKPLGLKNTFLLKDSLQIHKEGRKIALPYFFEGETKPGFFDYGYSASAGLVSTVRDLAIFSEALDNNSLITEQSRLTMFTPLKKELPYGYGIFTQEFQKKNLIWGYGQYDCFSSLFLKVPDKKLAFIITANNNLISDPARLIYGDVTCSLFALSFVKNYVLELGELPVMEDENSLVTLDERINENNSELYLKKLIAQSVAESYMARFDQDKFEKSRKILETTFKMYPDYIRYGESTLLHGLSFLKAIASEKNREEFSDFDKQLKGIATKLLRNDADNPYINYYLASYYLGKDSVESASSHYSKIVNAKNFSKNWYTKEAENWVNGQKNRLDLRNQ